MINPASKSTKDFPFSHPKYCGECRKLLKNNEKAYRIGYAGKKKRVCGDCFDKYGADK
ncbi:hypothetical protein LCGC14_0577140 [marine sediment metagenome]|uniref:Uncharacterized protein n=1 Tax=marine sediment metagenome TaxID=412755 RepID=A0A0F9S138_9ZZZZ